MATASPTPAPPLDLRDSLPADPADSADPAADPAVDPAAPRRRSLSPSRAADFLQCPLLYRFRVIDKLPEPPSSAALRGTLVHAVLERMFDLPADQRTPEQALALLPEQWHALRERSPDVITLFESTHVGSTPDGSSDQHPATGSTPPPDPLDEDAWLASAAALVRRWFTLEDPTRLEPAERELLLEAELPSGLLLRGYVDRLDISPGGLVRVVDYKTGRSPREGFEAKALFQMRFYALALWTLRGVVPALLQLVYLGDGQVVRYTPTADDLAATRRKVEAIWQAIEQAREREQWLPRRSALCSWCAHQAHCPEFGGTPPPLPHSPQSA